MEINDMPDEILLMIFKYIPAHILSLTATFVCRRWNDLINSRIMVLQNKNQINDLHRGLVVILAIQRSPTLICPSVLIYNITVLACQLRELTIHCKLPLGEMDFIVLSTLQHLKHLDVFSKSCVLDLKSASPSSITSLVVNNNMTKEFLQTLCDRNKINSFHMYGRSMYYPPRDIMSFIKVQSTFLREISLRCNELMAIRYTVIGACPGLVSLCLYGCWMLTSPGTPAVVQPRNLRCLHLTGARMVHKRELDLLIKDLPPLIVDLNLSSSWFCAGHCDALARRLPTLRRFELWRCNITNASLVNLANKLKNLEELDTDVEFSVEDLKELEKHGSLKRIRCRIRDGVKLKKIGDLKIRTAGDYRGPSRRGGEGPSADTFYYWEQRGGHGPPPPGGRGPPPPGTR